MPLAAVLLLLLPLAGSEQPPCGASEQCVEPPPQPGCGFRVLSAAAFAAQPPPTFAHWPEPMLLTNASTEPAFAAPFAQLARLQRGEYDDTTVSVGSGSGTSFFEGAASSRMLLGAFRAQMTPDDSVFDTQNSQAGRHAALPIPGVEAEATEWWNVLSVGGAGAGLMLHEHGAAWLALGSGCKEWVSFPPAHENDAAYGGRPAVESAAEWFAGMSAGAAVGGPGRRCSQPPGSVVLLPEGWTHATLNVEESWAVGRQREWQPEERLTAAERAIDPSRPADTPLALLGAGLALKMMAMQRTGDAAAAFAQPAAGMLATVAGLQQPSLLGSMLAAMGLTPPPPPVAASALRLKAMFGLLDAGGEAHWAGPPGLPGARKAATAAAEMLQAEMKRGGGAPAAAVADGLDRLGMWWMMIGGDLDASTEVFVAAWVAVQQTRGLAVPLAALHAGLALARKDDCKTARAPLSEAMRLHGMKRWMLSEQQVNDLRAASRRCGLPDT